MIYFWRRIGAFIIDLSIISMFSKIIFQFIAPVVTLTNSNIVIDFIKVIIYLLVVILISTGYNVGCYRFFKYPLGKLLMNIKVLDENGERVTNKKYFLREWNKYVYIYATMGLYIPVQFIINVVREKQCFHDKQSDTHIFM